MTSTPREPARPAAIILAAGLSRRAAPQHKLLLPAPGDPSRCVLQATVEAFCGAQAVLGEILVVTGHERARIEAALTGLAVRTVFAPDYARGMGHSLGAGVRACSADTPGFLVAPADLPWLSAQLVARVAAAATDGGHARHIIPTAQGRRGHPVFLAAVLRSRLAALEGDVGARLLLQNEEERMRSDILELGDEAILRDVDRA